MTDQERDTINRKLAKKMGWKRDEALPNETEIRSPAGQALILPNRRQFRLDVSLRDRLCQSWPTFQNTCACCLFVGRRL